MYLLRALKALGLINLISFLKIEINGVRGRSRVDKVVRTGNIIIFFLFCNCHFIFMLLVEGNRVRDVE